MENNNVVGEKASKFDELLEGEASNQEKQIEELQKELEYERDARREERFLFIILLTILFNVVIFQVMPSFGGPFVLFILQLFILIPLARKLRIQEYLKCLIEFWRELLKTGCEMINATKGIANFY